MLRDAERLATRSEKCGWSCYRVFLLCKIKKKNQSLFTMARPWLVNELQDCLDTQTTAWSQGQICLKENTTTYEHPSAGGSHITLHSVTASQTSHTWKLEGCEIETIINMVGFERNTINTRMILDRRGGWNPAKDTILNFSVPLLLYWWYSDNTT